ncbi:hypothetical protein [Candidatus Nephthysia bennettiae]|uniref:Uncharacterized protein n=1 Tax=Candidatus Nephthysia bennettiae TaxID=3127016 RepID=A0A934NA30_9BACT|nr:hypothetical protein [Candidatus Dormibacteraeota bacterium]
MTPELDIARPLTATEETILAQLAETFFAEAVESDSEPAWPAARRLDPDLPWIHGNPLTALLEAPVQLDKARKLKSARSQPIRTR